MDLRKIKKLIDLLEASTLSEMEVSDSENTIRLSRATPASQQSPALPQLHAAEPPVAQPLAKPSASEVTILGKAVVSPLVGTFYASPSADAKPYVTLGAEVNVGDTLCLIEAMKTFNQIEAEIAGVVSMIHKNNSDPVEYGEPLFVITPK